MISPHLNHSTSQCVGTKVHPILTVSSLVHEGSQEMSFSVLHGPPVSFTAATPKALLHHRACSTRQLAESLVKARAKRICGALRRVALSRVAQAGAFTKGSVPSPCRQGAEEEAFRMILHLKDILTYSTTLRIQYNSI